MLLLWSLESHINQHRKQAFHWQNPLVLLSSCIPGPCPTEWFYNFLGSQMGTDDQSHQSVPDSKLEGCTSPNHLPPPKKMVLKPLIPSVF